MAAVIRAAGGVLWRLTGIGDPAGRAGTDGAAGPAGTDGAAGSAGTDGAAGRAGVQVCLVHRPRYDDWSLPKGKLDTGERPLAAAVREVEEETAVRATPQVRLSPTEYATRDGVPKTVEYWSMRVAPAGASSPNGHSVPNNEVDELRWLDIPTARRLASYPHDAQVLAEFAALPPITGLVLFVRHAHAGERSGWPPPDSARPLDPTGHRQATALADLLTLFQPTRLISAPARRCLQTLAPLARLTDQSVDVESVFDEAAYQDHPSEPATRLRSLAEAGGVAVVCGQGLVIRRTMPLLAGRGSAKDFATAKATGWVLPFAGDGLVSPYRLDEA